MKTRRKTAKAAALGPADMNAATGAGAPWYTSGAQIWNGAAETLNATPTKISPAATPTIESDGATSGIISVLRISVRFVKPVVP